jgi:surface polysaccharide O-acyltransferase-like enzyme
MEKQRIASIDTLRTLAIFAVIIIHVNVYYHWHNLTGFEEILSRGLAAVCLWAVPLFFTISGYFFGKSLQKDNNATKTYQKSMRRLIFIFIAWGAIYSFPHLSAATWQSIHEHGWLRTYYWHLQELTADLPRYLITGGTWHLWFLTALMQSITLIFLFIYFKRERLLIYCALCLYTMTPLVNLYFPPAPGPDGYMWNTMLGLLISIGPVTCGWWLSRHRPSHRMAFVFLVSGCLVWLLRDKFLGYFYHLGSGSYGNFDFVLISAGWLTLALLHPDFGKNSLLSFAGRLTLGIYCAHMLVLDYLRDWEKCFDPFWWHLSLPLTVFIVSFAITVGLRTLPLTRKLAS